MAERLDIVVLDSQVITQNTQMLLGWDFEDRDGQVFSIISGTLSIFTDVGVATAIVDVNLQITQPGNGRIRVQLTLLEAQTAALAVGPHHARIRLVLGDGQTRRGRAALRVRKENF